LTSAINFRRRLIDTIEEVQRVAMVELAGLERHVALVLWFGGGNSTPKAKNI
jgi:hypothetical protein